MFEYLENQGYTELKVINGEVCGLMTMVFTVGLFLGLDYSGYRTRYCYPNYYAALDAIQFWDGQGDPPGPWIKQKPEDRLNPNL